jgi:hypothetical protein
MCVYVYVCVCVCVCMCMCVYVYVYVCVCIFQDLHIHIQIRSVFACIMQICMYACVHVCTSSFPCIHPYHCTKLCIHHACMHVRMKCMHTHTFTNTPIQRPTYTQIALNTHQSNIDLNIHKCSHSHHNF